MIGLGKQAATYRPMLDSVIRYLAELEASKRLTLKSATLFWTGIAVAAFFLAAIITAQADIQIDRTAGPFVIRIWITNTIKESDAKQLQEISNELGFAGVFDVWLDSTGGDVSAAIKIGKLIRKYDGTTIIDENRKTSGLGNERSWHRRSWQMLQQLCC
jgi:hypothetical protein